MWRFLMLCMAWNSISARPGSFEIDDDSTELLLNRPQFYSHPLFRVLPRMRSVSFVKAVQQPLLKAYDEVPNVHVTHINQNQKVEEFQPFGLTPLSSPQQVAQPSQNFGPEVVIENARPLVNPVNLAQPDEAGSLIGQPYPPEDKNQEIFFFNNLKRLNVHDHDDDDDDDDDKDDDDDDDDKYVVFQRTNEVQPIQYSSFNANQNSRGFVDDSLEDVFDDLNDDNVQIVFQNNPNVNHVNKVERNPSNPNPTQYSAQNLNVRTFYSSDEDDLDDFINPNVVPTQYSAANNNNAIHFINGDDSNENSDEVVSNNPTPTQYSATQNNNAVRFINDDNSNEFSDELGVHVSNNPTPTQYSATQNNNAVRFINDDNSNEFSDEIGVHVSNNPTPMQYRANVDNKQTLANLRYFLVDDSDEHFDD